MQVFGIAEPGAPAEEIEIATPELTGASVLVKITHSGICHSDVHCAEGYFDLGDAGQMPVTDAGAEYPFVLGHEIVGEVVAAGPEAGVEPGDTKYIVYPWIGCGECQPCRDDNENYCIGAKRNLSIALKGGFAREVWVPDSRYLIPVGDLDPAWAATLACSGVTGYAAVSKVLTEEVDRPIAVVGTGGVGLSAVALLAARGHKNIVAADVNEASLENARKAGATATVLTTGADPVTDLVTAGGGKLAGAIDFVNNGATSSLALGAMGIGGKLVSVGLFGGQLAFPTTVMALNQLKIEGNFVGSLPQLRALVDLANSTELPKLPITEAPLEAQTVNDTLQGLAERTVVGRVVMVS
ncbi:alcohol dehydrogenase [Brevibacterium sp. 91QC2O2]|uniref:alcohol dehydrogenase n=1 Tax=Brevibacterium TaxID=1696 RepID=UPI00211CDD79|nr:MULTISPECIES: alcohol dehydrogenase [unclassified Brevibacterium]MCQ9368366.1 alcohol dehydrogenase [Brevibacterium sp. 91QC2O2]MCQ9384694.1 alcohol dehydrogenase [Brevibacterium sp. 68QC2CO]